MVLMLLTGLLRKPFPDILTGVCQGVLRRENSSSTQAVLGYVGRQRTALYGLQEESQSTSGTKSRKHQVGCSLVYTLSGYSKESSLMME